MSRFAHLSDCHIGAWRDLRLRELNIQSFEKAYDTALEESVDFIVISGDLFHVNLPELESVRRVVAKLRQAQEADIPTYVVFGSHDYSPNATAMIDILTTGKLLLKAVIAEADESTVKLRYITDEKTKAKLCGLSGRSYTLERSYFEALDRASLEEEKGFRIFILHSAIEEVKPTSAAYGTGIPASYLPTNLDYYAGGHIHQKIIEELPGFGLVAYPGPLMGSTFTDLEITAKGERRGFIIVDFEDKVTNVQFCETQNREVLFLEINGEKRTYKEVEAELLESIESIDPHEKIVLIRLQGVLSAGKATDIDFRGARLNLQTRGAEFIFINRRNLTSREAPQIKVAGETPSEIEEKILREALNDFRIPKSIPRDTKKWAESELKGDKGVALAMDLLQVLKNEKVEGETNHDYEERLHREVEAILQGRMNQ